MCAVRGPDVEPDRQRDGDGDERQEHVEPDRRAGQRDGQPCRHRQTLAEVCRRVIPAEEGPLPADDSAVLQGVYPVQRELQQPGPVVVEGNLVPQAEAETSSEMPRPASRRQQPPRRGSRRSMAAAPRLRPRQQDDEGGDGQRDGVRPQPPTVERAGLVCPAAGRQQVRPGQRESRPRVPAWRLARSRVERLD